MVNNSLDIHIYEYWEFLAKDTQIEIFNQVCGEVNGDSLVSRVLLYDYPPKPKSSCIHRFSTLDMKKELIVCEVDEDAGIKEGGNLKPKPCRALTWKKVAEIFTTKSWFWVAFSKYRRRVP
jgi:hypothetical protein